jgi:hypothetical protein
MEIPASGKKNGRQKELSRWTDRKLTIVMNPETGG